MDVLDEKPVTLVEVEAILKKKDKQYKDEEFELSYEQKRALEHASKFARLSKKDTKEITSKLKELDLGLGPDRVAKIIDILPESTDDVRAIFAKERFKYTEEDIKQITNIIAQYR